MVHSVESALVVVIAELATVALVGGVLYGLFTSLVARTPGVGGACVCDTPRKALIPAVHKGG